MDLPSVEPVFSFSRKVYLTRLRFFYLSHPLHPSILLSPVSPEVRQALQAVVDFLEDNYGVRVVHLESPLTGMAAVERDRQGRRSNLLQLALGNADDSKPDIYCSVCVAGMSACLQKKRAKKNQTVLFGHREMFYALKGCFKLLLLLPVQRSR